MKVRIMDYTSRRYYGGRVITSKSVVVSADFVKDQADGSKVVRLCEPAFAYPAGYLIAVWSKEIIEN